MVTNVEYSVRTPACQAHEMTDVTLLTQQLQLVKSNHTDAHVLWCGVVS